MKKIFLIFFIFFCFSVPNAQFYGGYGDGYSSAMSDPDTPLPVEITEFTASHTIDNIVELYWQTATEVNNFGFDVERHTPLVSDIPPSKGGKEGGSWETLGFVQGHGTTNSPKEYSFTDDLTLNPNHNQVSYRLKQIDLDGTIAYSKIVTVDLTTITSVEDETKYEFAVEQNYPNPFNPSTKIIYTIPTNSLVKLIVFDVLGREVRILVDEFQEAGRYSADFKGDDLSSGVYLYRLTSEQFIETKKLILLR